jgi:VWFA-related protein
MSYDRLRITRLSRLVLTLAGALVCALLVGGRPSSARQQATFRSGVDLFQLDVTVLDPPRHPLKDLVAADFTILEDGQPRPVVTFKAVDIPAAAPPGAAWLRDIPRDVVTNARPEGRIVVIVIDDASFEPVESEGAAEIMDAYAITKVRDVAKTLVNALGPDDLAAVVYTENNFNTEDFTKDHRRLLTAIDQAALVPSTKANFTPTADPDAPARNEGGIRGGCYCGLCSMETVERIAESLTALQQERKTLIYISAGLPVEHGERGTGASGVPPPFAALTDSCKSRRGTEMENVFRVAQRANVTIQAFDPRGPMTGGLNDNGGRRTEFLRTMAERTGGRAIVNTNTPDALVSTVLEESSSYYLLGFESGVSQADGRHHTLDVKVNRPGLEVLHRSGFYAPTEKEQKAIAKRRAPAGSPEAAMSGPLPSSDLPLALSLMPFLGAGGKPQVAAVVGVTEPNDPGGRGHPRSEQVDIVAGVFGPSGNAVGSERQSLTFAVNPTPAEQIYYEAMTRLPVPKGRHSIRIGVRAGDGRLGSVYAPIDVPDFTRDALSLSGVFLSAMPAARTAPADVLRSDHIPIVPTARRVFTRTDRITSFVRVYQAQSRTPLATRVILRITNDHDQLVTSTMRTIAASAFERTRAADHEIDLPIETLAPGTYLLTVTASAGNHIASRATVFSVR